ncbi:MAG: acetyl-CoA acetyltransferase [Chloroflexi bacterium]|nr:acetyl-CoA acetyltransferase [Chloroflexota bacterium]
MTSDNCPVIVGVGQYVNRSEELDEAREPAEMMAHVARAAEADACVEGLLARVDSLQVVNIISWPYTDAPALLAERLGARPSHTLYSSIGGDTPQRLINQAAQAIAEGRVGVALLVGAEVMNSRRLARQQGRHLPWSPRGTPARIDGDTRTGNTEVEARHGATVPTRVYPLFENAIRAHLGLSIEEHRRRLGALCARLAAVAAGNPYAWFPRARTADEIIAVGPHNRMICFPYPKLMNAIMEVDQAAAVIITSAATARRLDIPEERWVYLRGCGDANDKWFLSQRLYYHSSPAIRLATQRALTMAGIAADDIAMFDFYSCFPSAVQLALDALELQPDDPRPLTVTGGLPYAGGPGNNYVMHSVATTVQRLRDAPDSLAMVTGLGWYVTKHSVGVYSGRPPQGPWQRTDPAVDQAQVEAMESPSFLDHPPAGEAVIETYTVAFDREGRPEQGIVIGRLAEDGGPRFFANTEPNAELMWAMTRDEFIGRRGHVRHDAESGKNVFSL